jgi:phytol kinase
MGAATAAALIGVAALQPASAPPGWALLAIAGLATGLEQWASFGVDNLTVPLAVAGMWVWLAPRVA